MTQKSVFIFLIILLGQFCHADSLVGKKAPQIRIRQWITEESRQNLNLQGRVHVIEFWAMWCNSCVQNIPHFNELNNKYRDQGLVFVALSQDRSADELKKFVKEKKINYHVAQDKATADLYDVKAYPTVAIVNHEGIVTWFGFPWERAFEKEVNKAIEQGPPPLLIGVDLGYFGHLRKSLFGGENFAKAYKEIQSYIENDESAEKCNAANQIIDAIDHQITEKISAADELVKDDPVKAYNIYSNIVENYSGIEVSEPARAAYLEMKKHNKIKHLLATQTITEK